MPLQGTSWKCLSAFLLCAHAFVAFLTVRLNSPGPLSEELLSLWSTSRNCRVLYWVGQKVCLGVCKMVQETWPTFWLTQCLEATHLFRFSCSLHNKAEKTGISVHILWMRQLKFRRNTHFVVVQWLAQGHKPGEPRFQSRASGSKFSTLSYTWFQTQFDLKIWIMQVVANNKPQLCCLVDTAPLNPTSFCLWLWFCFP